MKNHVILATALFGCATFSALAQNDYAKVEDIASIQKQIQKVEQTVEAISERQQIANANIQTISTNVDSLTCKNGKLSSWCDSLQIQINTLNESSSADRITFTQNIEETRGNISATQETITSRTIWAIVVILLIIVTVGIVVAYMIKRIKSGASSIDEVRAAQDALQKAQSKLQEESVAIDNKLAEILTKQLESAKTIQDSTSTKGEIDHSLALKVADEIVRIETNLSRMDSSVKGYKQLTKAVQRIKDNFAANGYEIVDMLNKPYNSGMKAAVTFVTDESLKPGQQIITKIIKPQINYKQQMIQAAQIEVSQPE